MSWAITTALNHVQMVMIFTQDYDCNKNNSFDSSIFNFAIFLTALPKRPECIIECSTI